MILNLSGVPLRGGATGNICLGFDVVSIARDASGIRADVRVHDVDYPAGPSEIFPAHLGEGADLTISELETRAVAAIAQNIRAQTENWKRMGRMPEVSHVAS